MSCNLDDENDMKLDEAEIASGETSAKMIKPVEINSVKSRMK